MCRFPGVRRKGSESPTGLGLGQNAASSQAKKYGEWLRPRAKHEFPGVMGQASEQQTDKDSERSTHDSQVGGGRE